MEDLRIQNRDNYMKNCYLKTEKLTFNPFHAPVNTWFSNLWSIEKNQ